MKRFLLVMAFPLNYTTHNDTNHKNNFGLADYTKIAIQSYTFRENLYDNFIGITQALNLNFIRIRETVIKLFTQPLKIKSVYCSSAKGTSLSPREYLKYAHNNMNS